LLPSGAAALARATCSHSAVLGILGMPRRTMISAAPYIQPEWQALRPLVGIGGSLLFVSALLYFLNMLLTCVASHAPAPETPAFAAALSGPEEGPAILDCWRPWLVFAVILLILAYGHPLVHLVSNTPLNVPGMRIWVRKEQGNGLHARCLYPARDCAQD
jgi:cytochrome c oxidase subunit 1